MGILKKVERSLGIILNDNLSSEVGWPEILFKDKNKLMSYWTKK